MIKDQGFTLIEFMLSIMLLVLLIGIIIAIYLKIERKESLIISKEKQDTLMIENAMKFYRIDNGFYPTNEQGIAALSSKPTTKPIPKNWTKYLDKIPMDSGGKPYHYLNPGRFNSIEIFSCGPTRIENFGAKLYYWLFANPKINCEN